MRSRPTIWILLCLLLAAGAWLFWRPAEHRIAPEKISRSITSTVTSSSTAPKILSASNLSANAAKTAAASARTNPFAYRLTNTAKTIGELVRDDKAILLDNALIETGSKLNLSIPKHLQSQGDPGAYIVQARGPVDNAFRTILVGAGAQIVSYIPNNAYLVRIPAGGASTLAANPLTQSVIPYEPYYKISSAHLAGGQKTAAWSPAETNHVAGPTLLGLAVENKPLPTGTFLTLGLFGDATAATIAQIEKLGGKILSRDTSPFGPIVRVQPPADWTALATLPGVQIVEAAHLRKIANDLARVTLGISTNTIIATNYLGLTGKNVIVEVNDTGVDAQHPDFSVVGSATSPGTVPPSRVFGDSVQSLDDTDGHGTHVAGIIAGNGSKSLTPINVGSVAEGSVTNADFRGKAPLASLYVIGGITGGNDTNVITDSYLQQAAALTNALISNNSWVFDGDNTYDLEAASYDAATRDALPGTTGSQPVLFVFAAGNSGSGDDDGGGGNPDTIMSPATAKDVISVGALEQLRNITNSVTNADGTIGTPWKKMTDSSFQVAGYSSRGNVGIGTEGTFGRYKPDVVAPGTFVVSTRSEQWDQAAYYNPTNIYDNFALDQVVDTNGLNYNSFSDFGFVVKSNTVDVSIQILPNALSPVPFPPNMPIYVSLTDFPDPTDPTTYDFTNNNNVTIPPDGLANYLSSIVNNFGDFNFGVGDGTNFPVNYDLQVEMVTTNDLGNYYTVLSNLNDTLGPWYRYETGTSMATPAVSGVLALMQDFFTNTLNMTPSPALLKAMLINGARPTGFYNFQVDNTINLEGWGLINLPNSIPSSLTNLASNATNSFYFIDQSPTNALATGDSRTYKISLSPGAQAVPLRVTLAWTDPPGNPAAAIKLVNNLDLIITNTDNATNTVVYYGNDIAANQVFNTQENPTNSAGIADAINNVENVFLPANAGTNFTIVIYGTSINVNAVTAQINNAAGIFAPNVVQDFAFVMSSGNSSNTNGFAITSSSSSSNPTGDQRITIVTSTNASSLLNQFVGASSPLLGTNTLLFTTNTSQGFGDDWQVTIGMTNQWHFYVVTNYGTSSDFTNAGFITFLPPTLSIPREGVFADSDANSTRPEADIDLFVTTDPNLLTLSPATIANCINGTQVGASSPAGVNGVFNGSSLGRGGTEFVVDTNSTPGQVYYVGVQAEDQMASEYAFLSEFSNIPFSQTDSNGNEYASFFQVNIPDGDATHPGYTDTVAISYPPIEIENVVVTNILAQQNVGDLVISLNGAGNGSGGGSSVVLLNHDSPNTPGIFTYIYDDSLNPIAGSQPSDGPGSLQSFVGQQDELWTLHTSDNVPGFVGSISGNMFIEKHRDLTKQLLNITVGPLAWFYDFLDVPVGYTNLDVFAIDQTLPTPVAPNFLTLAVKLGSLPTLADPGETNLVDIPYSGSFLSNSVSVGPPLTPGIYFVGIYNPDTVAHDVLLGATLSFSVSAAATVDYASSGAAPILDDAVMTDSIVVTNTDIIRDFNVGIRVDHPRISDLVFHLISPDGTRYLLMENRGGATMNGAGLTLNVTNVVNISNTGDTNINIQTIPLSFGETSGTLPITYNFFTEPDEMTVYYGPTNNITLTNDLIFDTGFATNPPAPGAPNPAGSDTLSVTVNVNFPPTTPTGTFSNLTIVMNQFGNPSTDGGDSWTYTAGSVATNYSYLAFTEDTNLTTTPIKFAPPPFVPAGSSNLYYLPEQDISALNGQSAAGTWTLEIQDDRAGAGLTNTLVSWQLGFTFANTNLTSSTTTLTNGVPSTNTIAGGSLAWFAVNVPTNADFATNILLFATNLPVNVWFSTNIPPSITNTGDIDLIPSSTGNSVVLSTTTSPAFVPGGTYYLGVQNTNATAVTYALEVDFHLVTNSVVAVLTNGFGLGAITSDGTNLYVVGAGNSTNYVLELSLPLSTNSAFAIIYTNVDISTSLNGLTAPDTNLFWIDPNANPPPSGNTVIFRGDKSSGPITPYDDNPGTIFDGSDLASDGSQLFAVDYQGGKVARLGLDFSYETQIGSARYFSPERLNTLTVANGTVYVADSIGSIVSLSTNGGSYTSVYVGSPFITPNAITVSGGALFVVDAAATNTIWELPISGGTPTTLVSGAPFRVLNRITYLNHALYVTDNDTNGINGTIYQISLPNPTPSIGGVSVNTNGVTLNWTDPIYDEFQVQWTTNLAPPVWTLFPDIITSTNGVFSFTDTNTPMIMKFYQIILLP